MNRFIGLSTVFLCLPQKTHRANYGVNCANYGGNRANNGKSCKVWVYVVLTMGNRAKIKIAYFIFLILKLLGFYLSRQNYKVVVGLLMCNDIKFFF